MFGNIFRHCNEISLYCYTVRKVPVIILSMLTNTLQNLLPSVIQRLIQKPFAEGAFQVASMFWGSGSACKAVIACQLISMPENIPGHMYALYLYQYSWVLGVSGSES